MPGDCDTQSPDRPQMVTCGCHVGIIAREEKLSAMEKDTRRGNNQNTRYFQIYVRKSKYSTESAFV